MSKGKGDQNYQNRAAKRFKQMDMVPTMSQQEIFEILEEDFDTIVDQVNEKGKFPNYILNGFANLSTTLWFYLYVTENVRITKKGKMKTDLTEGQIHALKEILSRAFKKSATQFYDKQSQEFVERNKLLSEAFMYLDYPGYKLTGKLNTRENKLKRSKRRELCIQVYGNPVHNMKFIFHIFDSSSVSDKKKMKIFKKMYGDRFTTAVGAALCVNNTKSDFLSMVYDFVMKGCVKRKWGKRKKMKARKPFIEAYAKAYKWNQTFYFKLKEGDFYKKNKKMIKKLIDSDIGYQKAFKGLKPKKRNETDDLLREKKMKK